MSKVQWLKLWLCIGMLFAFLSGGTMSWLLNQVLRPVEALPSTVESSDEFVNRFVEEIGLDEAQAARLEAIVQEWKKERLELERRYRPEFTELNEQFQTQIDEILTPEQLELYKGGR